MSNLAGNKTVPENTPPQQAAVREIDTIGIMERLPHRYPMLMIDKIVDLIPGESATGVKSVTINEPFFQGHFPGKPVMPGVLIVEAMAQTAAIVVVEQFEQKSTKNRIVYFMTIEEARFRKPVLPGDSLRIKVSKQRQRGNVWKFRGEAWVEDTLCAEAVYSAMLFDNSNDAPNEA